MGRSGLAVAESAARSGDHVTVFDEKMLDTEVRLAEADRIYACGAELVSGWHGRLKGMKADLLVTSPGFTRNHPALLDALDAGMEVISEVEYAFRIAKAPIVAITGTNGKSTTTVLTYLMCKACGKDIYLCGNLSGSGYDELTLTEAAMRAGPDAILVAEISSYQLEWVQEFRPKVATILNVTPDHFDRHPDFEDYQRTKQRISAQMAEGDTVVFDPTAPGIAGWPLPDLVRKILVGPKTEVGTSWTEEYLLLRKNQLEARELALIGPYQIQNAAYAFELAKGALDGALEPTHVESILREFKGLDHRLQRVADINGVQVLNNSMCTNPAALKASSEAIRSRQIILLGGNMKNLEFDEVLQELGTKHKLILFGDPLPGTLQEQFGERFQACPDLKSAFEMAILEAEAGETIVLSPGCASSSPYANFRERGVAFMEIVRNWQEANRV